MAQFQTILPVRLGQAAITTGVTTLYTCPADTRTFVKTFDVCNTTGAAKTIRVFIVPSGGSASTTTALVYDTSLDANTTFQWTGTQVMNAGDVIQIQASATGCTITASGGEAT